MTWHNIICEGWGVRSFLFLFLIFNKIKKTPIPGKSRDYVFLKDASCQVGSTRHDSRT